LTESGKLLFDTFITLRGEMHFDVTRSRFIQLVRMPSRIYNRGELEKNQQGSI